MVHIKDEGSHFDAPIDMVWKFVQAPMEHGESHSKNTRNVQMKPINEMSVLLTQEENMNGTWVKTVNRITNFPPLGFAVEILEGPLAGSKMLNVYTPKGEKTGIDVYGEFASKEIPAAQLEHAVRANLEAVFHSDSEAMKAFLAKK